MLVTDATSGGPHGDGPWMVKAQVPVGGRGKAGGVVRCASSDEVAAAVQRMLGSRLKGHQVDACLVEQAAEGEERYLAVMVDAASYGAAGDLRDARRCRYRAVRFGTGPSLSAGRRRGGRGARRAARRRA